MSDHSKIEWCDSTWSPVLGCSPAGRGCAACYAIRTTWRLAHNPVQSVSKPRQGLVEKTASGVLHWTGEVRCLPDQLEVPLRWKRPRRIFVCSQADLFHPAVPDDFIEAVFGVMSLAGRHRFQVLTKRPERMRAFLSRATLVECQAAACVLGVDIVSERRRTERADDRTINGPWPLPNVMLGVSVENQAAADERIPELLATPAALRFASCEPLLGPVDLTRVEGGDWEMFDALAGERYWKNTIELGLPHLDWVIAGCESGSSARPMNENWVRALRDQCISADVKFFYKQRLDGHRKVSTPELDGRRWVEMPEVHR